MAIIGIKTLMKNDKISQQLEWINYGGVLCCTMVQQSVSEGSAQGSTQLKVRGVLHDWHPPPPPYRHQSTVQAEPAICYGQILFLSWCSLRSLRSITTSWPPCTPDLSLGHTSDDSSTTWKLLEVAAEIWCVQPEEERREHCKGV